MNFSCLLFVGCSTHTPKSLGHSVPAQCRARVGPCGVLLGLRPFPPPPPPKVALLCSAGPQVLRRSQTPLQRTCPPFGSVPSRTGLDPIETFQRSPGSRACCFSVLRFLDYAGPDAHSRSNANARVAFPSIKRGRRPETDFSKLNSPARRCPSLRFERRLATQSARHGVKLDSLTPSL